jgi:large subunit ribosomal protein L18e
MIIILKNTYLNIFKLIFSFLSPVALITQPKVAAIPNKCRGSHMSKNNRKTNQSLIALISDLKDQSRSSGSALWRDVALRLETSRSNWAQPNLSRLSRHAKDEDMILVPGKLLGSGDIFGKANVAAFSVSSSARSKIGAAGGRVITIRELMKENPNGKGVRILG